MARDMAQQALEALKGPPQDQPSWHPAAQCCMVLGRVHAALNAPTEAIAALQQGVALQAAYCSGHPQPAASNAAVLCCTLADVLAGAARATEARAAWEQALTFDVNHTPALLQLARHALQAGDPAACEARCSQLLRIDPDSQEGHVLMVDALAMQERAAEALQHLQPLLTPGRAVNYALTARYLDMLQRAGGGAESIVLPNVATGPAGLHFCQGLVARGAGDRQGAAAAFTSAMADSAWRARAAVALLRLLLEGALMLLWEGSPAWDKGAQPQDMQRAKDVADTLTKDQPLHGAAWQALAALCAGGVAVAECVLGGLLGLLFDHQQHPGLLLATAAAHLAGGQAQQVLMYCLQ